MSFSGRVEIEALDYQPFSFIRADLVIVAFIEAGGGMRAQLVIALIARCKLTVRGSPVGSCSTPVLARRRRGGLARLVFATTNQRAFHDDLSPQHY